ncbi:MAG TPA: hypothetical protein VHL78_06570 [Actinomycetota bacterium]|nr:hypothetical protein [Actinomycetota bacterium]
MALEHAVVARSPTDHGGGRHVYVNGELHQMPYSMRTEVTLERGRNDLRVEYVDHLHRTLRPAVAAEVTVVAA